LRFLWIAAGFLRLRRYRREARTLAQAPIPFGAAAAGWYLHDAVPGPVTYGWLRPSVLLPARFQEMTPAVREAIACHELVHVTRRDWVFVIAEELIRAVLWFHPAVWLILSRIQLAREQVVDREAIRLTADRDRYLEALVAVAAQKIRPDLAPAPLFLKKRHLSARVASVLKEVSMSKSRLYTSLATVCSAVLVAARLSVWLFPFTSPAQVVPDDPGITVETAAPLMHRTPVHLPASVKASGVVALEVSLDAKGEVSDARVLSGPEELRKAALESVLGWHFTAGPARAQVSVKFAENRPVPAAGGGRGSIQRAVGSTTAILGAIGDFVAPPPPPPPPVTQGFSTPAPPPPPAPPNSLEARQRQIVWPGTLKSIEFAGLSPETGQELSRRLPVHEGDPISPADMPRVDAAVKEFDSHLRTSLRLGPAGSPTTVSIRISAPSDLSSAPPPPPPPPPPPSFAEPAAGVQRIRVGGNVQSANLTTKVTPTYPPLAKQARIQGAVSFSALIGVDGKIRDLQIISGHPLLTQSAVDAVKQWVYRPTLLNGNPVEVVTQIDVNYTLLE
jgi:protein TonB